MLFFCFSSHGSGGKRTLFTLKFHTTLVLLQITRLCFSCFANIFVDILLYHAKRVEAISKSAISLRSQQIGYRFYIFWSLLYERKWILTRNFQSTICYIPSFWITLGLAIFFLGIFSKLSEVLSLKLICTCRLCPFSVWHKYSIRYIQKH